MAQSAALPFETQRLGSLVATHKTSPWQWIKGSAILLVIGIPMLVWGISLFTNNDRGSLAIFILVGVGLTLWGVVALVLTVRKGNVPNFSGRQASGGSDTQAATGPWFITIGMFMVIGTMIHPAIVVVGLGVFLVVLPIWSMAVGAFRNSRTGYLFSDGFCYINAMGKPQMARWDEVETVWVWPTAQNVTLTVLTKDGNRMEFGDPWLDDYRGFADSIEKRIAATQLPRTQAAFDKGAEIEFGPIRITKQGLVCKNTQLTWQEVHRVQVARQPAASETGIVTGMIQRAMEVRLMDGKTRQLEDVKVNEVANLRLMIELLKGIDKAGEPTY